MHIYYETSHTQNNMTLNANFDLVKLCIVQSVSMWLSHYVMFSLYVTLSHVMFSLSLWLLSHYVMFTLYVTLSHYVLFSFSLCDLVFQSAARPADWKSASFASSWHTVQTTVSLNHVIPVLKPGTSQGLEEQLLVCLSVQWRHPEHNGGTLH